MYISYFDPIHPGQDGRKTIPFNERVARHAAIIIRGEDELLGWAARQGIMPPTPDKSARIESRTRAGNGYWITVRGSEQFFISVKRFIAQLDATWA